MSKLVHLKIKIPPIGCTDLSDQVSFEKRQHMKGFDAWETASLEMEGATWQGMQAPCRIGDQPLADNLQGLSVL